MRFLVIASVVLGLARSAVAAPGIHVDVPTADIGAAERTGHIEAMSRAMTVALHDVKDIKHVDIVATKLVVRLDGDTVGVTAELEVVVSNARNEIRAVVSGSATLTIARRRYKPALLPELRRQVLIEALDGVQRRLRPRRVA